MRHSNSWMFIAVAVLATSAVGQDAKPNLSGKWQLNSAKSQFKSSKVAAMNWTIEQKGSAIHVVKVTKAADGTEKTTQFNCTTDGKECPVDGTKVSLYYAGTALIEMQVSADVISKTTMKLASDGKSVSVDVSYIVPDQEAESFLLEKS